MSKTVLIDHIQHILAASRKCVYFIDGMEQIDFNCDVLKQDAVLMNFIVIGEAATKIMQKHPDFIETNQHIPWKQIRGLRNQVAHGYFDVDLVTIWNTVKNRLPELIEQLENLDYPTLD
ncbi:HepT-like ribonuclease domain-containing protein [Brenneria tiliae]|uniref:DUF86 domain-containing protein n=1 Tax=Brenneria tiliae TaxID=2914984 RepID=A0ABT0MXS6_9GAMM|nr:DUF86 domain-containing protein [Brenneria tiliae]MCL2894639.1 DUF86 domain-containing protein [Brenneria tiliae]MCL2896807.1 DUF86 domain-containing protein [Brenneria tiliae]MCL2901365.1 DUF86 domain-containing protein [Brenneria tiliae]